LTFYIAKGKHMFGIVKVGERGQIVIPQKARDLFNIKAGDSIMVLGDENGQFPGLAMVKNDIYMDIVGKLLGGVDMTAIQAIKLEKKYKGKTAVNKIDVSIEAGELFALLGVDGAGKTTTIKMLSCLISPTSGDALLLGDSIVSKPNAVKEKINVSPQETAVAPNLTIMENLVLIAEIYGNDKKTARMKADEMISAFGLADVAQDRAKTLSGGMQRRISIAKDRTSSFLMRLFTTPRKARCALSFHSFLNLRSV